MPLLLYSLQRSLPQLQPAGATCVMLELRKTITGLNFHLKNNLEDLFQVVCNAIHTPLILKLQGELFFKYKVEAIWKQLVLSGSSWFEGLKFYVA